MGAEDRVATVRSRMEQVRREMAERRALRHRNGAAIREKSLDSFKKLGPAIAQIAKDSGELARRRQVAGGWSTEKIDREPHHLMGLGLQDEDTPAPPPEPRRPPTRPRVRPARHQPIDDEDDDLSQQSWMTGPPPRN